MSLESNWPITLDSPVLNGQDVSAAAIIYDSTRKILLQLREDKPGVAFPGYWGLFGGRVEPGELPDQGLQRELFEELALFVGDNVKHFSTVAWDGGGLGPHVRIRHYFLVAMNEIRPDELSLGEGADIALAPVSAIPEKFTVMPHDHLAISMWQGRAFAKKC